MANDELYTPKWIFDDLNVKFDLDVCAPIGGPLHTPCEAYFDVEMNGLEQQWFGNVWMNPPFSCPTPWVEKWLSHGKGIALLPLSGNSKWWQKMWTSSAACVMMPPGIKFVTPHGGMQHIMYGISLWAVGQDNIKAIKNADFSRVR